MRIWAAAPVQRDRRFTSEPSGGSRRQRVRVARELVQVGRGHSSERRNNVEVPRFTRADAGLGRLHHGDRRAACARERSQRSDDDGLADTGVGAGDDEHAHAGRVARAAAARSKSASVRSARAVSRSRLTPSGTEGGRKHPTRTPRRMQWSAAARAAAGEPSGTATIAAPVGWTPASSASRNALRRTAVGSCGSAARIPSAPEGRAGTGGRERRVEDERSCGTDEVVDDFGRGNDSTALAAERLRQRHGANDVGFCAETGCAGDALAAFTDDPEGVCFVDDEERAVSSHHLVQCGDRRDVPVDGEHRVGDDECIVFVALRECVLDGGGVSMRYDDHPGPRQPARVDHRRVIVRVGDDQRSRPASAVTAPRLAR